MQKSAHHAQESAAPPEKALLITGAARRVGRSAALFLAARGYDIAIHYHRSKADALSLKQEIEALGRRAFLLEADLLAPDCDALIAAAKAAFPYVCGLIHNASLFEETTFASTQEADYDRDMNLHVKTPYFLSQAYARQVGKGSIIALLDTNIRKESHAYFPYLLAKKSLAALMRQLARELAPDIRVNCVAPGITPFSDDLNADYIAAKVAQLPLRRVASAEEIARAIHTLLEAEYLIGHTLFIDGGEQLL